MIVVGNTYPETETFGIISYVNGGCFLAEEEDPLLELYTGWLIFSI